MLKKFKPEYGLPLLAFWFAFLVGGRIVEMWFIYQ